MKRASRALLTVASLIGCLLIPAGTASADAEDGTCGAGYRLESYGHSFPAYNWDRELMWKIHWKKRWCYSVAKRRVGTVYAPKPSVTIYSYFEAAWNSDGTVDSDAYYSSKDWTGQTSSRFPRRSHVSWHKVKLEHCAFSEFACTADYVTVGIVSYWDGSKNLIVKD